MYKRPPDRTSQTIKIPKNYSGSAFRFQDSSPDLISDTDNDKRFSSNDFPEPNVKDATDAPRDLPREETEQTYKDPYTEEKAVPISVSKEVKPQKKDSTSLFSSLLPSNITSSCHFPFGHGIGSEELLILAMMLLVYLSEGETDNEFLLLLGLLLFAG